MRAIACAFAVFGIFVISQGVGVNSDEYVVYYYYYGDGDFESPCGDPPEIEGAYISEQSMETQGTMTVEKVFYSCMDGRPPQGPSTLTCSTAEMSWSTPMPTCPEEPETSTVSTTTSTKQPRPAYARETTILIPIISERNGPKCRHGLTKPHSMCLPDSTLLLWIEDTDNATQKEILDRHNYWRRNVWPPAKEALPALMWDEDLAVSAERWCAQCPIDHDVLENRALPDRGDKGKAWPSVGQNMCLYKNVHKNWTQCIDEFADERFSWAWGYGPIRENATVGHYTQMVSILTVYLGCGKCRCRGTWDEIMVCNYAAAANKETDNGESPFARPYSIY